MFQSNCYTDQEKQKNNRCQDNGNDLCDMEDSAEDDIRLRDSELQQLLWWQIIPHWSTPPCIRLSVLGRRVSYIRVVSPPVIRWDHAQKQLYPSEIHAVRSEFLGTCINNRVDNARLKTVASRAVWLGNDYAHYTRKYEDFDIANLKHFIDACLHWIQMELLTDQAENMDHR